MKPIFLLGWLCFALNITALAPEAAAQKTPEPPKPPKEKKTTVVIVGKDTIFNSATKNFPIIQEGPGRDSLIKAMNKLSAEMNKLAAEMGKKSAKISEKYSKDLEAEMEKLGVEMEKLGAEMEKLGEQLEKELEILDNETETAELESEIEEEVETDIETEEHAETGDVEAEVKDSTKKKTVVIDEEGIHIRTKKNKRPKNVIKKPKNSATDWFLLDLGVNTFTNNKTFDLPVSADPLDLNLSKSINTTLHLFRTGVNIYHHNLYTTFGLAYDMHDYRFTKNTTLLADTNRFAYIESPYELDKNKLSAQYVTLPVMLHFESNPMRPSQSFKIGIGGWGGFLVNSYTKQKSEERGKQHLHDNFNLNTINYGVRGQIGYGLFTLYSQYALSPLFKKNAGAPELNPVTFGIILNGFKWN